MPSSHSSSSHSSSSHSSSSHSSSSHSSSSHSSSSHSSSSYSSSSRSSSSSGESSYKPAPPYSSFEHTEFAVFRGKRSDYVRSGSMKGKVISRERRHQPCGYSDGPEIREPSTVHYGLKHNYVYYPEDWVEKPTETTHKKGYYDENGDFYERVVFWKDGYYHDVPCTCEFCGVTTLCDVYVGTSQVCKQCGAPLRIDALLDEYTQDPAYTEYERRNPEKRLKAPVENERTAPENKNNGSAFLVAFFIIFFILPGLVSSCNQSRYRVRYSYRAPTTTVQQTAPPTMEPVKTNPQIFGYNLYLDETENGYILSPDGSDSYDRKLTWDYGEDSYYEKESDCWLWYNTDVSPNLWQYWYEGISSDYGDYGWMEYEPDGWYIEASGENWIKLPEEYVSERLWHMEIDPADFE